MGLFKLIAILGVVASVMQPTYSASIGNACICTLEYNPLCGSDGQTYANKCEFTCAKKLNRNLEIFSKGECVAISNLPAPEENNPCICAANYDPLCGSDGQTYGNKCDFNCAKRLNRNLEIFSKGECVTVNNLPAVEDPIEIHNLPANEEADTCICPFIILDPICGSDGETYPNNCEFNCAKKLNRNLEVFSKGQCVEVQNLPAKEESELVTFCTLEYNPLCGSDGQTYANKCMFNYNKKLNRNLEVHSMGECVEVQNLPAHDESKDIPICTLEYNPLCGSDGQTYANECIFNYNKRFNRNLEIFARGECIKVQPF